MNLNFFYLFATLQNLQLSSATDKNKLKESGSIKFTQPQLNTSKINKDKNNISINW